MAALAGLGAYALTLHAHPVIAHFAGWPVVALLLMAAAGSAAMAAWDSALHTGPTAPLWHLVVTAAHIGILGYYSAALVDIAAQLPAALTLMFVLLVFAAFPAAILGAPVWRWLWNRF